MHHFRDTRRTQAEEAEEQAMIALLAADFDGPSFAKAATPPPPVFPSSAVERKSNFDRAEKTPEELRFETLSRGMRSTFEDSYRHSLLAKQTPLLPLPQLPSQPHEGEKSPSPSSLVPVPSVEVAVPRNLTQRRAIDLLARYVSKNGQDFEKIIEAQAAELPELRFLKGDRDSDLYRFYRWRVLSLISGDTLGEFRHRPFYLVEGGKRWVPPCRSDFTKVWNVGVNDNCLAPERTVSTSETRAILEKVSVSRKSIQETMAWALDHGQDSKLIVDSIFALVAGCASSGGLLPLLYLLSDLAHNCLSAQVKSGWAFRDRCERGMPAAVECVAKAIREELGGAEEAGKLRRGMERIIESWTKTEIFGPTFLGGLSASLAILSVAEDFPSHKDTFVQGKAKAQLEAWKAMHFSQLERVCKTHGLRSDTTHLESVDEKQNFLVDRLLQTFLVLDDSGETGSQEEAHLPSEENTLTQDVEGKEEGLHPVLDGDDVEASDCPLDTSLELMNPDKWREEGMMFSGWAGVLAGIDSLKADQEELLKTKDRVFVSSIETVDEAVSFDQAMVGEEREGAKEKEGDRPQAKGILQFGSLQLKAPIPVKPSISLPTTVSSAAQEELRQMDMFKVESLMREDVPKFVLPETDRPPPPHRRAGRSVSRSRGGERRERRPRRDREYGRGVLKPISRSRSRLRRRDPSRSGSRDRGREAELDRGTARGRNGAQSRRRRLRDGSRSSDPTRGRRGGRVERRRGESPRRRSSSSRSRSCVRRRRNRSRSRSGSEARRGRRERGGREDRGRREERAERRKAGGKAKREYEALVADYGHLMKPEEEDLSESAKKNQLMQILSKIDGQRV